MSAPATRSRSQASHRTPRTGADRVQRALRFVAAALSAVTALLYSLIATGTVIVLDGPAGEVLAAQRSFGLPAAIVYAVGVALLLRYELRLVWMAGAVLQVLVIAAYFNVAPLRVPAYEAWGITIRIVQVLLLGALTALALRPPSPGYADRTSA